MGEGVYDYIVADVSGHDAGTALATSALKALLRQNAEMFYSPAENLKLLNYHLRSVLQEGQFISLIYARVNRILNRVTLINAGHPAAIWLKQGEPARVMEQEGDLLGIFEAVSLEPVEIQAVKGDRLFLLSDGLIEQGPEGAQTRFDGFAALLQQCSATRPAALDSAIHTIMDNLFITTDELLDDVVLLGLDI